MDSTKTSTKDKSLIKSYKDLIVWQKVNQLALSIYEATQDFPKEEELGISLQMRKAVISTGINIAQGFTNRKDSMFFYEDAAMKLRELESLISISNELGYTTDKNHNTLYAAMEDCSKLLWGWIKAVNK